MGWSTTSSRRWSRGPPIVTATTLPASAQPPASLSFNDAGHLFASANGSLVELVRSGSQWVEVGQPLFGNVSLSIGSPFIVSRSRTNHDPAYHTGPEWFQTDPDDLEDIGVAIEDCPGDVNDDRLVDVSDLLAQRSQRGDCAICTRADVDGNRAINTGDLLELLARWGPCD